MDALTTAVASGLRSRLESLDVLANNLANANTSGFKADREQFSQYVSEEVGERVAAGLAPEPTLLPTVESRWTDFSQGSLRTTGQPTDLALGGPGFLAVRGPNGPVLTRGGSFMPGRDGELLSASGQALLLEDGKPLRVDPARPFEVGRDGVVTQAGRSLGRLQVVAAEPGQLSKLAGGQFVMADPTRPTSPAAAAVHQGQLESANAGPVESTVRLVGVMRQFEMLQKALGLGADMNRRAVDEVARVGR